MRIAKIVGTVTLSRCHPLLEGGRLKLAVPMSRDELQNDSEPQADELVVYDELGTDCEDRIFLSEGAEAAQPFYPELKPIDAYNAGIIDELNFDGLIQ